MRNINNIIKAVYGDNGLDIVGNQLLQQSAQPQQQVVQQQPIPTQPAPQQQQVAADNPLQIYSQNITDSFTENQYDYDAARRRSNEAMAEYQNMLEPQRRLNEDYVNGLNEIYKRYTPDKIEPARQDERLAGIQSLATALADLGRAAGKSLGNNDGLGMVTVDATRKFDNNLNYLKQAQENYRKALMDAANAELQRQLAMNDMRYNQDKDLMQQGLTYGQKAYEKALENSKRSRTYTTKYEDPNSVEAKERAAKIQREIDKDKFDRQYRQYKYSQRINASKNGKKNKDVETYYSISNPIYKNKKRLSSKAQKAYDNKTDMYIISMVDAISKYEYTPEQLDTFYKSFYKSIKLNDSDAKYEVKPGEQIKQIESVLNSLDSQTKDNAVKIYNNYIEANKASGIADEYWHLIND